MQKQYDYIKSKCSNPIEGDILDLGCGNARMIIGLLKSLVVEGSAYAVDDDRQGYLEEYYPNMNFEEMLGANQISLISESIEDFFIEPNPKEFELIILSNVLHFYSDLDKRKALYDSMFRILSDFGNIYIQVASENHPYKGDDDKTTFDLNKIIAEIGETKLELVEDPIRINNGPSWHFMLKKRH